MHTCINKESPLYSTTIVPGPTRIDVPRYFETRKVPCATADRLFQCPLIIPLAGLRLTPFDQVFIGLCFCQRETAYERRRGLREPNHLDEKPRCHDVDPLR